MRPDDREGPPAPISAPPAALESAGPSLRLDLLPPGSLPTDVAPRAVNGPRWALAIGLFFATLATSVTVAPAWYDRIAPFEALLSPDLVRWTWSHPEAWRLGFAIALPALLILLCHELGHYVTCRLYGIRSTLPYFVPAPFGFGSLGAFIRIQSPIRTRRELFDVGIAGPIAGFVALLPWLVYGIAHSTPVAFSTIPRGLAGSQIYLHGRCLAMQLAALPFHGWLGRDVVLDLHPFAMAAWIGLFATALNLIPLSQLDGGHIFYAAAGKLQHRFAWPVWFVLAGLAFAWPGWGVWCLLTLWLRVRHPPVWDESEPLDAKRRALAWVALLLLVLCFMPMPLAIRDLP